MKDLFQRAYALLQVILLFAGIGSIVVFFFYRGWIATTNEFGYLGFDKAGRQIFIQTLDNSSRPEILVTSEYYDRPFLLRLYQEPMRTTLRFDIQIDELKEIPTEVSVREELSAPCDGLISMFSSNIANAEDSYISVQDLKKYLDKYDVKTLEDFYDGLGFNKFEIYHKGKKMTSIDLRKKRGNVKHVGM